MMEMSRGADGDEYQEMGVVKTEVPTKVHWAKRKWLDVCRFHFLI